MSDNKSRQLIKHSSIYAAGNILRQLVGFIMLPIYTNYLSPSDYGVVGLLTFAISVIEGLFGARLGEAMPKFFFEQKDDRGRLAVISTAILLTSAVSLVVIMPFIASGAISSQLLFGSIDFATIVQLFAVLILTNAIESQVLIFIRIQQRPWLFISATLFKLALQLSLNIYFVVHRDMGVMGVAIGSITAASIISLILACYSFSQTAFRFDRELAMRMVKFSWPLWISGIASLYVFSANRYYIRIFSSLEDVGLFELGAKFAIIIIMLIYRPFSQYWDTERFRIHGSPNATEQYQSAFKLMLGLLTVSSLGIAILAPTVIDLMAADTFHQAAAVIPYLTLGYFARCLTDFFNFSFFVTEKTGWITRNYYMVAALITIFYLLLIPEYGFVGAGMAVMLGECLQFLIVYFVARKHYDMGISLKTLILPLVVFASGVTLANITTATLAFWSAAFVRAAVVAVLALFCIHTGVPGGLPAILNYVRRKLPS